MTPNELNPKELAQYRDVAHQLRCLVCQNQSIADSHASLALDLKEQIADQVHAGKTNAQIKQYMVDRYGEFVLYKPAYSANNAVLWAGPFVVLILAFLMARRVIKKSRQTAKKEKAKAAVERTWADEMYEEEQR